MEMNPRHRGGKRARRGGAHHMGWWLGAVMAVATLAGCTGADRNDPTYNTKQILINDRRQ
jgi:hypothetical protein